LSARDLLGSSQRFFCALGFGYIDDSPHELDKMTDLIANWMTDSVDVPDGAARMDNSVLGFEIHFLANRLFEQFLDSNLVFRTKALKECFEPRWAGVRIETKDAISFF
jgi:hypothetical protein